MSAATPYRGLFASWADVTDRFCAGDPNPLSWGKAIKTIAGAPEQEPEEVLWAEYTDEDYQGSALVIYRQGNKVYEVTGSHRSCFGLEGQWQPEEYDIPIYIAAVEKRGEYADEGALDAIGKLRLLLNG